jgi:hypothetical protein
MSLRNRAESESAESCRVIQSYCILKYEVQPVVRLLATFPVVELPAALYTTGYSLWM